jgi:hypothetical protein
MSVLFPAVAAYFKFPNPLNCFSFRVDRLLVVGSDYNLDVGRQMLRAAGPRLLVRAR